MTSVVRAFSILGLALVVGLIHSWVVPITIAAEANEKTAQQRIEEQRNTDNSDEPNGQAGSTDPSDPLDPVVDPGGGAPDSDEPDLDAVTDPKLHIPLSVVLELYRDHVEQLTGEVVLIDARGAEGLYEQGHISGAEHMTYDTIHDNQAVSYSGVSMLAQERMAMVLPDQWVIIYCGGGDCDESENVRNLLIDGFGLTNAWIFEAGYPALEQAGLPTVEGSTPFGE